MIIIAGEENNLKIYKKIFFYKTVPISNGA
jgi:hypothetical protein